MPGTLILCATPIGNLGDAPPRLGEALDAADVVYAEDTRRAQTLLAHLGVQATLRSYFVGNEQERSGELAGHLEAGETVALITDAGTPVVADPGVTAVRAARRVGAVVTAIPGPSAVTMALAVSGFGGDRFIFEGFLPRKGGERAARIEAIGSEKRTVVCFTTGSRVAKDLADLAAASPADRKVVVCRELTKAFEEVWHGLLSDAPSHWEEAITKGEFTLVLEPVAPALVSLEDGIALVKRRIEAGERPSEAAKTVAKATGLPRSDLYGGAVEDGR
jgi:16S rRNA (cytidine1402-2'-O)-methyltransferase